VANTHAKCHAGARKTREWKTRHEMSWKCGRLMQQLFLPRDASAESGYEIACRLSVRLYVCITLRYRDHMRWNSLKIISRPNIQVATKLFI